MYLIQIGGREGGGENQCGVLAVLICFGIILLTQYLLDGGSVVCIRIGGRKGGRRKLVLRSDFFVLLRKSFFGQRINTNSFMIQWAGATHVTQ